MTATFFACHTVDDVWKALWQCTADECEGFCDECVKHNLNLCNTNARDLLKWLDLEEFNEGGLIGEAPAKEVVARCQRRLWDEPRNIDPKVPDVESGGPGTGQCKVTYHGRDAGYLREKTEQLLFIAQCAGEHYVCWT